MIEADSSLPGVSVVVIGRNEGERLERCLASIRAQEYPPEKIELIYSDGASTDDSCAVAEKFAARVLRVLPERTTAAAGRNLGWRSAQHALVHFVDGDTIMHPAWLARAVRAIEDVDTFAVRGRCEEVDPAASIYNFWAHHDWFQAPGKTTATGGIALFRREALEAVNGFDESLVAGEEPEMCHRVVQERGGHVLALDEPMVRHDIAMTCLSQYWRRCRRTGYGYAEVVRLHPNMHSWRRAIVRNMVHASAPLLAAVLSIALKSWWPALVWAALLFVAWIRNGMRHRARVGSLGGALKYSAHHYLSKYAMAIGQLSYWLSPPARPIAEPITERQTQT